MERLRSLLPLLFACAAGCAATDADSNPSGTVPHPTAMTDLDRYVDARIQEAPAPKRLALLEPLAKAVAEGETRDLLFICTHNSRRSQMAQVWAQMGARCFGLDGVRTWSGGTEVTAFHPNAVAALRRAGFQIEAEGGGTGDNPRYRVTDGEGLAIQCFSKRFADPFNPQLSFAAVMTCSEADQACPAVPGAARRFALAYEDPKVSDGTGLEAATYDARCAQIATEMLWVMRTAAALRRAAVSG